MVTSSGPIERKAQFPPEAVNNTPLPTSNSKLIVRAVAAVTVKLPSCVSLILIYPSPVLQSSFGEELQFGIGSLRLFITVAKFSVWSPPDVQATESEVETPLPFTVISSFTSGRTAT